jgi:hypothetical protein
VFSTLTKTIILSGITKSEAMLGNSPYQIKKMEVLRMNKIKEKKGQTMFDNLVKQVYGFCTDTKDVQILYDTKKDKRLQELQEDSPEKGKIIFNTFMTMKNDATILGLTIHKILVEYDSKFNETMMNPLLINNPQYQEYLKMFPEVNIVRDKLWNLPCGFYMDDEQGLWLWIDSENMNKNDILEALVGLMKIAESCLTFIRNQMVEMSPGFRKLLAGSGMYPEYVMN